MQTCDKCKYFKEFEENSFFKSIYKLDGFCECLECGVMEKENICNRFVEKKI